VEPRDRWHEAAGAGEAGAEAQDGSDPQDNSEAKNDGEAKDIQDDNGTPIVVAGAQSLTDARAETETFVSNAGKSQGDSGRVTAVGAAAALVVLSLVITGCAQPQDAPPQGQTAAPVPLPESSSGYYGVYTSGNVVLFGKLESANDEWITLSDVHYVRSGVNPDTKQMANQLVKRNREWHQPGTSAINRQNVLVIEPVAQDSRMMGLIKSAAPASTEDPAP
jgi:hypothetical protein